MTPCVVQLVSSKDCPSMFTTLILLFVPSLSPPNHYQHTRQDTPAWLQLEMTMRDAVCVQGAVVFEPLFHMLHG